MAATHFTEPTTEYWQEILPATTPQPAPWKYGYPSVLPDNRILVLPIRRMHNNPNEAVASLIINQASIDVASQLGEFLAKVVKPFSLDVIIGLPTLGLTVSLDVARNLGLKRYVPLGYSRKFWYDDKLSTEVSSITSPTGEKKLYLDPNQLSLVRGKRVVIIDDAISSGKTLKASWDFLEEVGCEVLACGVVMKQGARWKEVLGNERTEKVVWVFESQLLKAVEGGWDIRD